MVRAMHPVGASGRKVEDYYKKRMAPINFARMVRAM